MFNRAILIVTILIYVRQCYLKYSVRDLDQNSLNNKKNNVSMVIRAPFSHLPTISSSLCVACGRTFLQMSRVNIVLALLNMDVSELIMADNMTANRKPRAPVYVWWMIDVMIKIYEGQNKIY